MQLVHCETAGCCTALPEQVGGGLHIGLWLAAWVLCGCRCLAVLHCKMQQEQELGPGCEPAWVILEWSGLGVVLHNPARHNRV